MFKGSAENKGSINIGKEKTDVRGGQHHLPFRLVEGHRHHRGAGTSYFPGQMTFLTTKLSEKGVSSLSLGTKSALSEALVLQVPGHEASFHY